LAALKVQRWRTPRAVNASSPSELQGPRTSSQRALKKMTS
jgi:hypothetical protein